MSNAIHDLLLRRGPLTANLFAPSSRYYGLATETLERRPPLGPIIYLSRRFVPPPEQFATRLTHVVTDGDRIDNLAATYLGDPELFWQICDANRAMDARELTATPGRRLRITLPRGIATPGVSNG